MNMKKTFLATLCLMTGMTIHAQQIDVQPVPQIGRASCRERVFPHV